MKNRIKHIVLATAFSIPVLTVGQHNYELNNNGARISIQAGAEVYVLGDVHMGGATGILDNDGLLKTQGNSYSDNAFQQTGTGTYRIENSDVNTGERQFIQGSFAVRGGTSAIGVDDGSFYNLELNNDQGIVYLVGTGNVADVRNAVDFYYGSGYNRIVTHDIGISGAITYPANGEDYTGVFGLMNDAPGLANLVNNTVTLNGSLSTVDSGFVQGNFRRAIDPAGGTYQFVLGLEPAGSTSARGVQYNEIVFAANDYDVVTGYFQQDSSNAFASTVECSGNTINYFGGTDHGQWVYEDITGAGSGTYEFVTYPQDHNMPTATVWLVTKDNAIAGTADDCGPTPVGLSRTGFDGFSSFGLAASVVSMPIQFIALKGRTEGNHNILSWEPTGDVSEGDYVLERKSVRDNSYSAVFESRAGKQQYVFTDYHVGATSNYRVRLISNEQENVSSNVVQLSRDVQLISVYPNPASDNMTLMYHATSEESIEVSLVNVVGQEAGNWTFNPQKGVNGFDLALTSFPAGTYLLKVAQRDQVTIIKMVKE